MVKLFDLYLQQAEGIACRKIYHYSNKFFVSVKISAQLHNTQVTNVLTTEVIFQTCPFSIANKYKGKWVLGMSVLRQCR